MRQKRPASDRRGYLKKTTTRGPVVGCPDYPNCPGECRVATIATERLISSADHLSVFVVCTTCWKHRFVGAETAARMKTTVMPPQLRTAIQRDEHWRKLLEMTR